MMFKFEWAIVPEVIVMADRNQFLGVAEADPRLVHLLVESRNRTVTDGELREQRISFAFGNSFNSKQITKESVRKASESIRLISEDGRS